MKKLIAIVLALTILAGMFAGCAKKKPAESGEDVTLALVVAGVVLHVWRLKRESRY